MRLLIWFPASLGGFLYPEPLIFCAIGDRANDSPDFSEFIRRRRLKSAELSNNRLAVSVNSFSKTPVVIGRNRCPTKIFFP
jgi:hypothetical protein